MRDRNRSANYQRDIKSIQELFAGHPGLGALFYVIGDAIVAAQNDRAGQAHQFLCLLIQCATFISLGIKRKKPLNTEMPAPQQLLVHLSPVAIKIVHSQILSNYVSSSDVGFLLTVT